MPHPGMLCRWFGFAGAWLCFASLPAAASSAQPPTSSGVAEVRKDLEALKSAPPITDHRPISVPIKGVIELKSGSTPATPAETSRRSPEKQERDLAKEREKSRNWLLEGVAAQERADRGNRADEPAGMTAGQNPLTGMFSGPESRKSDQIETLVAQPEMPKKRDDDLLAGVTNPLAPFLSSWMRSEDFELLARSQSPSVSEHMPPAIAPVREATGSILPATGSSSLAGSIASAGDGGNPYLRSVEADIVALRTAGQPLFMPPIPTPAGPAESASMAAAPAPAAVPGLSEKLKSRDDARYFKQLKRF